MEDRSDLPLDKVKALWYNKTREIKFHRPKVDFEDVVSGNLSVPDLLLYIIVQNHASAMNEKTLISLGSRIVELELAANLIPENFEAQLQDFLKTNETPFFNEHIDKVRDKQCGSPEMKEVAALLLQEVLELYDPLSEIPAGGEDPVPPEQRANPKYPGQYLAARAKTIELIRAQQQKMWQRKLQNGIGRDLLQMRFVKTVHKYLRLDARLKDTLEELMEEDKQRLLCRKILINAGLNHRKTEFLSYVKERIHNGVRRLLENPVWRDVEPGETPRLTDEDVLRAFQVHRRTLIRAPSDVGGVVQLQAQPEGEAVEDSDEDVDVGEDSSLESVDSDED